MFYINGSFKMYKFIIYLVLFFVPLSMVYPQSNQEIDFDFSLCCNQNVAEIDFFEIIKKDSVRKQVENII